MKEKGKRCSTHARSHCSSISDSGRTQAGRFGMGVLLDTHPSAAGRGAPDWGPNRLWEKLVSTETKRRQDRFDARSIGGTRGAHR